MIFLTKPYQCSAIGCLGRTKLEDIMCAKHLPMIPKKQAALLAQHYDPTQGKSRKVSREFMAAAYRSITAIAVKEGKIKGDIAERREYYCVTRIEQKPAPKAKAK